jgi:phosphatidate cytidylyltransferase
MLAQRMITGIVGGACTIFIIYEGNWLFFIMMLLLSLVAWYEYCNMIHNLQADLSIRTGAAWIIAVFGAYWFSSVRLMMFFSALMMAWLLLRIVFFHEKVKPVDSAYSLYGLVYISGGFLAMLALRNGPLASFFSGYFSTVMLEPARFFVFLLIFSTWASDTFAFAIGKMKGRVKLCPAVSPHKTREGALGGFIGTILVALIFSLIFRYSLVAALAIGVIIGIVAPLGDLVESIIKRNCKVKDSGKIIPGHGGVLDRFDSLLFAAPALYLFLLLLA